MEKYLIFGDSSSHKFWRVRTDRNRVIVTFGKIGTAGQTQEKAYPSPEDAEKDASKQEAAAPKLAEGPKPVNDDGALKPWHTPEGWEYSWDCPDEETFAHLETDTYDISKGAIEFDGGDDEDDRAEKLLEEWWTNSDETNEQKRDDRLKKLFCKKIGDIADRTYSYYKAEPYIEALKPGVDEVLDEYHFGDNDVKQLTWLAEQGAEITGKCKNDCTRYIVVEYKKNPDPARIAALRRLRFSRKNCRRALPIFWRGGAGG